MAFPKSFTTVTPFSKALALSMLIVFPIIGFLLGMKYQQNIAVPVDCNYSGFCEPSRISMVSNVGVARMFMSHLLVWLIPLLILEVILKGYALWHAGKNKQSGWFVALFIINSVGILPLIYLLFVKPNNKKK